MPLHAKGTPIINTAFAEDEAFFAADIIPTNGRAELQFSIATDTATELVVTATDISDPAEQASFNVIFDDGEETLTASAISTGHFVVSSDFSYNFALAASGTVMTFVCNEIRN